MKNLKNLVATIIEKSNTTNSWNCKFYLPNDKAEIYLDGEKHDVTELFEAAREEEPNISKEVEKLYNESISDWIDAEMDLEFGDISQEECDKVKAEAISKLR